jgi:glycosyltransferase involved in cell wall biosynthesis
MKVSLIVAVYKDIEALKLIIEAMREQTYRDFEVIVAEDNDAPQMREYIASIEGIEVKHTFQEDRGVRKSRSVNNAILKAQGDYLIFIDGDCVPYTTFVESHVLLSEKSTALSGRRFNLGPAFSKRLRSGELHPAELERSVFTNFFALKRDVQEGHLEAGIYINPKRWFYKRFFQGKKQVSLLGCNYSCFKEDMVRINGIDESYGPSPVADDTDIEWRLRKAGITIKSCKFAANVFHLFHPRRNAQKAFPVGSELTVMHARKAKNNFRALIGLDAHRDV